MEAALNLKDIYLHEKPACKEKYEYIRSWLGTFWICMASLPVLRKHTFGWNYEHILGFKLKLNSPRFAIANGFC
jgi:hypothetical protein